MIDVLLHVAALAEKNASVSDLDYIRDGLLHCGQCHTPKQHKLEIPEREIIVHCLCECQTQKRNAEQAELARKEEAGRIERLRAQGIHDRAIHAWTFANDDGRTPAMMDKGMRYYTKWQKMYADNIGLLLWGDTGTGKTYLAACIANALLENGVPVLMTSFPKILNALSSFGSVDKNDYLNSFSRYKLLVVDDLGAERQSEFALEMVYSVMDSRYKDRQPLIVTTNLSLDEIKNPAEMNHRRIYDRLLEMCVPIKFEGISRRKAVYQDKITKARVLFDD